ncbi:MAG: YesK-like family protein [Bacillota bacterium]
MFWLQTAIFTIVVLCLSWWAGKRRRHRHAGLILPICFILFGLVLLISSFFIGRWEGMALSYIKRLYRSLFHDLFDHRHSDSIF